MKGPQPWFAGEADGAAKRHAPATARNRDVIADILAQELPATGLVLEIASGSGEHIVHFAGRFPDIQWQPSDPDPVARRSIIAWAAEAGLANVATPFDVDASSPDWPIAHVDALLCINMTHISPWEATLGLLDGATRLLGPGAPLIIYGPFLRAELETAPSNLAFDKQLRARDARFGIRAVEDIDTAASAHGLQRTALYPMPANNLTLVYRFS
ncbi:MAG: DUF938 domain-containing protein [Sphingobium sp.]